MLLDDLEQLISGAGITTSVFKDFSPSEPDDVIILTEYAGDGTQIGVDYVVRRVQVHIRSNDYQPARSGIWQLYNLFDKPIERITLANSGRWMVCRALQTPYRLSIDELGRTVFGFNMSIATTRD
jgi:hypothetical protein